MPMSQCGSSIGLRVAVSVQLGRSIASQMIVNVFYTFAKSVERGDFFGIVSRPPCDSSSITTFLIIRC